MEPRDLLSALADAARAAGISVRMARAGDPEAPMRSGRYRLRDRRFVVLVEGEAIEDWIDVVAQALADLGPAWLESQWLTPAVRARIEAVAGSRGRSG